MVYFMLERMCHMGTQVTTHHEQVKYLKKIEGQVRGVQSMIDDGRYCIDIIDQIRSIIGALHRVGDEIFKKHIEGCVVSALKGGSAIEKSKKINEVVEIITKYRKSA